jgi:hypothetical protein
MFGGLGAGPGTYNNKNDKKIEQPMATIIKYIYIYLVGGFTHLEKYAFVNGKDDIPYMKWKINKCLKPPTRYSI